jgi:hypothetical protein
MGSDGGCLVQHQVNLRGTQKHHDTIRDMMATSAHVFSSISRGGTQWVYGGRLFVVSARTNERHHHQPKANGKRPKASDGAGAAGGSSSAEWSKIKNQNI